MLVVWLSGEGLELWIYSAWVQVLALPLADILGMLPNLSQVHFFFLCKVGLKSSAYLLSLLRELNETMRLKPLVQCLTYGKLLIKY